MASIRFLNVNTPDGLIPRVQLGGEPIQQRGIKNIANVMYPRFTGVFIEDPNLNQTLLGGTATNVLLNLPVPLPGRSFVAETVDYDPIAQSVTLPYPGVSVCQVRVAIAYRMVTPPLTTTLRLIFNYASGPSNFSIATRVLTAPSGLIVIDRMIRCDELSDIEVQNIGINAVNLRGAQVVGSSTQSYISVDYLGVL